jgi:hypothetical protein
MRPNPDAYTGKKLYVKAGAGYGLRPEADVVWSPEIRSKRFQINFVGNLRSFFGNYHEITFTEKQSGSTDWKMDFGDDTHSGHDFKANAGVNGRYSWDRGFLTFSAGWDGLYTKSWRSFPQEKYKTNSNAGGLSFRVASNDDRDRYFFYDASFSFRGGKEKLEYSSGKPSLGFIDFSAFATLGPVVDSYNKILVDAYIGLSSYSDYTSGHIGSMYIAPHYFWDYGRWHFKVGAKIGSVIGSDKLLISKPKSQIVYPDVRIGFDAVKDYMNLYAFATGGDHVNNWASLKEWNHFLTVADNVTMGNSQERFNTGIGMEGNWTSKFRYDLKTGVAFWKNGLVDKALYYYELPTGTEVVSGVVPGVGYEDYKEFYIDFKGVFHTERVDFNGEIKYRSVDLWSDKDVALEPAPLTVDFSTTYNWNHKIYGGISINAATMRRGVATIVGMSSGSVSTSDDATYRLPGWFDLGLHGEYAFTRKLHFYLDVKNLLDADIQYHPGLSAPGISVIGGIVLNL